MQYCKLEIFIPVSHFAQLKTALNEAGAGRAGNYEGVLSFSKVQGCFCPLPGANPYCGKVGEFFETEEYKVEVSCALSALKTTIDAVKRVHPYEEPVINIIPLLKEE